MFASILRSSMFIALMLIVTVTLSGCSIDLTAIFSGIKTFIGSFATNIGSFLKDGVGMVKNVISSAKQMVEPIVTIAKDLFGNTSLKADKVMAALNKADATADKINKAGASATKFGNKLNATDALGNTTVQAPTSATVSVLDNEEAPAATTATTVTSNTNNQNSLTNWLNSLVKNDPAKLTTVDQANNTLVGPVRPAGPVFVIGPTADEAAATPVVGPLPNPDTFTLPSAIDGAQLELLSASEREAIGTNIRREANEIKRSMDNLCKKISYSSTATKAEIAKANQNMEIISIKIGQILDDPLNQNNKKTIDQVSDEIVEILNTANKYGNSAGILANTLTETLTKCNEGFDNLCTDLSKVFGGIL